MSLHSNPLFNLTSTWLVPQVPDRGKPKSCRFFLFLLTSSTLLTRRYFIFLRHCQSSTSRPLAGVTPATASLHIDLPSSIRRNESSKEPSNSFPQPWKSLDSPSQPEYQAEVGLLPRVKEMKPDRKFTTPHRMLKF